MRNIEVTYNEKTPSKTTEFFVKWLEILANDPENLINLQIHKTRNGKKIGSFVNRTFAHNEN